MNELLLTKNLLFSFNAWNFHSFGCYFICGPGKKRRKVPLSIVTRLDLLLGESTWFICQLFLPATTETLAVIVTLPRPMIRPWRPSYRWTPWRTWWRETAAWSSKTLTSTGSSMTSEPKIWSGGSKNWRINRFKVWDLSPPPHSGPLNPL